MNSLERPRSSQDGRIDTFVFLLTLAVVATTLGYHFGFGNQTEALPLIERFRNSDFLEGDFFVQTGSGFGPRFYYAHAVALLSRLAPVPYVMLALTFAINAGLAGVSHRAARELLDADRLTGWLAATLTLCTSSFALGLVSDLRFVDFQPGSMAIPWALAGLWQSLMGRPIRGALLCSVATVWQPLYGVETGVLALASSAARALLLTPAASDLRTRARALGPTALGSGLLGAASFALWALPSRGSHEPALSTAEVVDILAKFRAPHHYLPSTFPLTHYAAFGAFAVASALAFSRFWQGHGRRRSDLGFLAPPLLVVVGCLLGYLLVEVWPTRVAATAQPFRLLYVLKWQGFLLAAWLLARLWHSKAVAERCLWLATLFGSAAAQTTNFLLAALADRSRPRWLAKVAAVLAAPLIVVLGNRDELVLLVVAAVLLLVLHEPTRRRRAHVGALLLTTSLVAAVASNHRWHFSQARALTAVVTFDDHDGDDARVARWAKAHTPREALFLIPPGLGSFRSIAERAVVVDFKSVPFGAAAMREWYRRMSRSYGPVTQGGFAGLRQMDANYSRLSDSDVMRLAREFGATYAVLYPSSTSERPSLYRNATFRIVRL